MLGLFRKNTKVIIWSVIIVFVLWGGFSVGTQFQQEGQSAGQVFGKNISFQEFDRFYRSGQIFGASEEISKDPEMLRQSAWQGVIFSREAKRLKVDASDSEVRSQILKILDQQKVSVDDYRPWLERGLRLSPKHFEEMVRDVLRIQKLFIQITPPDAVLQISPEEVKKSYFEEKNQIAADFVRFPDKEKAEAFRKQLETPADWEKEKTEKKDSFQSTGGLVPAAAFSSFLQLSPADSVSILALEKDHFSDVIATGKDFSVFFVTGKSQGEEKEFEAQKTDYLATLKERKKQNLLMEKTQEILGRAKLVDHLKKPAEKLP